MESKHYKQRKRQDTSMSRKQNAKQGSIDLTYLHDLADGDQDFIHDIISMFVQDAPGMMQHMQVYFKTQNCDMLKITAHKLKSSVLTLGNQVLGEKLAKVEEACKAGAPDEEEMGTQLKSIYLDINSMIKALQQHI